MVDAAALCAYRLYTLSNPLWRMKHNQRRKAFLKEMAKELAAPHLAARAAKPQWSNVKVALALLGYKCETLARALPAKQEPCKAQRCPQCRRSKAKDTKTTSVCDECKTAACVQHSVRVCYSCYSNLNAKIDTDKEYPVSFTSAPSTPDLSTSSTSRPLDRPPPLPAHRPSEHDHTGRWIN